MISHHPSDDYLTAFAAGNLPLSQSLCIAAHIELCHRCRCEAQRLQMVGATYFKQTSASDAKVSEELRNKVLDAIDNADAIQIKASAQARKCPFSIPHHSNDQRRLPEHNLLPASLQNFLTNRTDGRSWKRLSSAIQTVRFPNDVDGSKLELLKIKPGSKMPAHRHTGEEITVVLQGGFEDDSGRYERGDIIFNKASLQDHSPIADTDVACICLTSVAAPIEFTGWFSRLLNPVVRRSHFAN